MVIRIGTSGRQEFYLQQLSILVNIIKQHVRNYLTEIFELITELWTSQTPLEVHLVSLVESIARALNAEFKPFLPMVLPPMLRVGIDLVAWREQLP